MKYRALVSDSAKQDIRTNARWYNKRKQGLGKQFTGCIKDSIRYIESQPYTYQTQHLNIRYAYPKTFPYMVLYYVEESKKLVKVIAVVHSSADPKGYLHGKYGLGLT